jgi:endonuclease-3
MVTPALLQKYPNAEAMSAATAEEIFPFISSISYPNNKAKHLAGMARMLQREFAGEVPAKVEELVKLPGVGRKTANVIASVIYNMPAMAVDTHVFRVSARLGLTMNAKNPLQCEKQLIKFIPQALIPKAHHWLILHGRYVCLARNPRCNVCEIRSCCRYYESVVLKKGILTTKKQITNGKKIKEKSS